MVETNTKQAIHSMSCGKKAESENSPGGAGVKNPAFNTGAWHGMLVAQ